ncbi:MULTISPECIES: Omp28-related outer membrane protein [Aequorivita]|uniref:Omp28-related outer membrane protein n=1 Tax=Aequorivita iocasae TaxID=2803865 RepID=A0ABX7DSK6_9FLAO|nr:MULTISPECIES: Omp28-related outer membrane protein [Aequorivita]QQX76983.1 Omp28-related outer membrane protein [Aequorivita iocasae]UCA56462.1 Omp28-related outer membrane protein [Aequorivita sp. F7]
MRNQFILKFSLLFAFIAIVACSKKEDPIGAGNENTSIVLTSDAGDGTVEVLAVDQTVTFRVTGSDGEDYTSSSIIYVNDTEIEGGSYTFSTIGEYTVKAIYQGITSNMLSFQVLSENERALTVDVAKAMRNQTITFGLLDSEGNNTASEAIFYVNNNPITGFSYSSADEGNFEVYAEYMENGQTITSSTKSFSVFIPKRKVVIEDYTGTWCGFCPALVVAIDSLRVRTDHIAVVAIHKTASSHPDPLDFPRITDLQQEFGVGNGFPKAQINRTTSWVARSGPEFIIEDTGILAMAGSETNVSIAINSQLSGADLTVEAKVKYENGSQAGDKLVVYLLESGVAADQANYFNETPGHPFEGKGNPIEDYIHNDGLRNSLSALFGDNIPETQPFQEFTKNYNFSVPSNYVGNNLSFVVMVVDSENNAKNAQVAHINETKDFE